MSAPERKGKGLEELRAEIDEIDRQLVGLLARRMELAEEIARVKELEGRPLRDERREAEVIERARKMAKELRLDPEIAETVMRVIISRSTQKQAERLRGPEWWEHLNRVFREYPAQLQVAKVLFSHGLRVGEGGKVMCKNLRVPSVQVAKEAGVDRRTVETTAMTLLGDEKLGPLFSNLEPFPYLKTVAHHLGLGVVEITAEDATKPGILHEVAEVLSKFKVSVRQVVADDPYLVPFPKITIVTDQPLKGKVIEELRALPSVHSVIVY
ncbi:MAG: chorismate mutase [Candidatus Hadarchaeales archaeon]